MARFALINTTDNSIIEFRDYPSQPPNPAGKPRKWLPCPAGVRPSVDPASEAMNAVAYTVNASDVTETWTKRALTAQEISDLKDIDLGNINIGTFMPLFKVLFNINNRVRVLEGQAALTAVQFRAAIKALL